MMNTYYNLNHAVSFQKLLWLPYLKEATLIVDATCGNGHDTLFLSENSQDNCIIYAMDIQEEALKNTKSLLEKEGTKRGIQDKVTYIQGDHGENTLWPHGMYDLVVFNLGYLPKGNHALHTRAESTCKAINNALKNLKRHGLISIVAYPGSDRGFEETNSLLQFLSTMDQKKYDISKWEPINQINNPPILFLIKGR